MTSEIGYGGLAAAMVLSRIFTEATWLPRECTEYGMQRFTVTITSFLLIAVIMIPLFIAAGKTAGGDLISAISQRSKALGAFIGVILSVYLLFAASETALRSHYYASSTVFDSASSLYFYVFVGAALLFAVYKGLEASSRTGVIIFGGLIFLLLLMTAALLPEIKPDRLYPALIDDEESFFPQVIKELSENAEALIFIALCGRVRGRSRSALPVYIAVSCALMLFMTFLYNTVFGRLTPLLDFPFYTLSSVSDITLLHRINGIDVMVWVMASVIKAAFLTFAFRETIKGAFGSEKAAKPLSYAFALASLALSGLFTVFPGMFEPISKLCSSGIPLAAVVLLVSSAALLCMRERGEGRKGTSFLTKK